MTWELCSKKDVTAIIPVSEAQLNDEWSEMVESMIRNYMRLPNYGKSVVITAEKHSGLGTSVLFPRNPPIISVEALRISDALITASDYVVEANYVKFKGTQKFPEGTLNVEIDYTSGSSTVAGNVKLCAASMIAAIFNYGKRHGSDASMKWADPDPKVAPQDSANKIGLTSHLKGIMKQTLERGQIRAR